MHSNRRALIAGLVLSPFAVSAQDRASKWPAGPVKIIVGFTPGNASDVTARLYAEELARQFGSPFVVENRPGAGGALAVESFVRANDDHTVLFGSSSLIAAAPNLYSNLRYDALKDLDTVALMARAPLVLTVRPDFPARTLVELVALAKGGAELTFGSSGNGAMNHLAMELLKFRSGIKMTHVPYKGAAQAMTDLLGGQIQVIFETTTTVLAHARAGRLRPLAVSTSARLPDLPDVPAVAESFPGFEAVTWAVFCVNAGASPTVTARLADAINRVTALPAVRERLLAAGMQPVGDSTPASSRSYWLAEHAKWRDVIRTVGIKLE